MKRRLLSLMVVMLAVTLACGLTNAAIPTAQPSQSGQPALETAVAATVQAMVTNAPTAIALSPTAEGPAVAPKGITVSFQNVSFMIPEGLATGAKSELVPAATEADGGPWGVAPEHIVFTLTGYSVAVGNFQAVVEIYPADSYAGVNSWAASSLTRLRAVLASPMAPLTNDNLPTVPFNGAAAQQYAAQAKILEFQGGTGARMLSQYAQFPGPILRDDSFYHYEGLTSDGKYLVAVLLPVILPLKTTADNPSADGVAYPADRNSAGLVSYYKGITDLLNAAAPESFQPTITQMDALIQSISISPK